MTQEPDERAGRGPPAATSVTVTIGTGFWRNFFKWAAGVALVFTLGFLLLFLNAAQLTGRDVAHKGLTRALASITEIDAVLAGEIRNLPLVTGVQRLSRELPGKRASGKAE